jgi:hypothetical protein
MYISILTNAFRQTYLARDLTTLDRKLVYHSILTYTLRQTYLYK